MKCAILLEIKPVNKADADTYDKMADLLISAENPLIISGYSSRQPESIPLLIELAETLGAAVLSGPTRINFPTTHPLSAGIEQIGGSRKANSCIAEADVILVIDYDGPYVPAEGFPSEEARIIHIDIDSLTQGRPLWNRGADLFVKADSREAIKTLNHLIHRKLNPERSIQFKERFKRFEQKHVQEKEETQALGKNSAGNNPISPDWLRHCLSRVIDDETIIVNHTISQSASVTDQIERIKPGTLIGCAGGSIQWALGAALGAKAASPDKTVVSLVSDGGFVWGCPVASLWSASRYQLPFLTIVFNNQAYGVIKGVVENLSDTEFTEKMAFDSGVDIMPPPDYASIATVCGGYGQKVTDSKEVLPALQEALNQVRNGKVAVVDVWLEQG